MDDCKYYAFELKKYNIYRVYRMKTINLGAYEIIKKNPDNSLYDILLCKCCSFTILRNNFSRHKNTLKHKEKEEAKNFPPAEESAEIKEVCCDATY